MVTEFIKQKNTRAFFNQYFKKPQIEKPNLLVSEKPVYPQSVGQGIEYFISAHLDFLYPISKRYITKNRFFQDIEESQVNLDKMKYMLLVSQFDDIFIAIEKYCKKAIENLENEILNPVSKINIQKIKSSLSEKNPFFMRMSKSVNVTTLNEFFSPNDFFPEMPITRGEILQIGQINAIKKYFLSFKSIYGKYIKDGKLTDEFLIYLLTLPKIRNSHIALHKFGDNVGRYNPDDLLVLKKLIKNIPKSVFNREKKERHSSQVSLNIGSIYGRPDFIIGDTLIEVKTTKDFFTLEHYNQLLTYLLIHMNDNDMINDIQNWSEKDFIRECAIKKIAIYYSYYGKLLEFETIHFFRSPTFKNAYREFLFLAGEYSDL